MTPIDTSRGPHAVPSSEPAIARLRVPDKDEIRYWSVAVSGLYLRVRAGGSRTWILQYRDAAGLKRKITLGRSPAMTHAAAIAAVKTNLARLAVGDDPAAARAAAKAKAITSVPVKQVFDDYLVHARQHVGKRYHVELERYLTQDLVSLHRVPAADLTSDLMTRAIAKVTGKTAPNRAKAAMSSALKFAAGRGIVPASTYYAARLLPANAEKARERVLTYDEMAAIWRAADPATNGGRVVRFLLLSGLRREEAGGLHSTEIDRENEIIRISASRMKGKASHIVPLTGEMVDLVGKADGYVFGRTSAAGYSGWSKLKEGIDSAILKEAGKPLDPWRLHDFRHTISTHLNEQPDAKPDLIDRLLAHKRAGTEAIYNHSQLIDAKRDLLTSWERLLRAKGVIHG